MPYLLRSLQTQKNREEMGKQKHEPEKWKQEKF
jgi:hypothetical protein